MKLKQRDTLSQFVRDVCNHQMTILKDDGVYRHIRFQQPGTTCYYFDLITWPGYLTICGDMGTWTFSRTHDMFDFFARNTLEINTYYWSEKLEAGAGCSARELIAKSYDHDEFCSSLKELLSTYFEDDENEPDVDWNDEDDEPDSDKSRIREIVRELCREDFNNDVLAYNAVYEADWPGCVDTWELCADISYKTYTSHFQWILFAIVWGISRYRAAPMIEKSMTTFLATREANHG